MPDPQIFDPQVAAPDRTKPLPKKPRLMHLEPPPTGDWTKDVDSFLSTRHPQNLTTIQGNWSGMTEPGNIDTFNRPVLKNPDGSISTTSSFSTEINGQEVLLPQVVNGKRLTKQQAIDEYRRTGKHLGKFKTWQAADAYAEALHAEQVKGMGLPAESAEEKSQRENASRLMLTDPNAPAWEQDVDSFLQQRQSQPQNPPEGWREHWNKWAGDFISQTVPAALTTVARKSLISNAAEPWGQAYREQKEQFVPFSQELTGQDIPNETLRHALTTLRHVGRNQTSMVTDPVNVALMALGGPVGRAVPLLGMAINGYFAGAMAKGAAEGTVQSAKQISQGDYWGATESGVDAIMSGAFAVTGARQIPGEIRAFRTTRTIEQIAQKDFGKSFKDLDTAQRGQVAEKVVGILSKPKYAAIAHEIASQETIKDLKAIKVYQDAQRQARQVGLPDRLKSLSSDQLEVLGRMADLKFGREPGNIPSNAPTIGLEKVDDQNVTKLSDRDINKFLVDIQFLTDARKAEVAGKKFLLEREQVRRRLLAADRTAATTGTHKDPESDLGNQLEQELETMRREHAGANDDLDRRYEERQAALREAQERRSQAEAGKTTRETLRAAVEARRAKKQAIKEQLDKMLAEAPAKRGLEEPPVLLEGRPQTRDQAFDEAVDAAKKELGEQQAKELAELQAHRARVVKDLRENLRRAADEVSRMREEAPKTVSDARRFKLEDVPTGELAGRFTRTGEPSLIEGAPKTAEQVAVEEAHAELAREKEAELRRIQVRFRKITKGLSEGIKAGLDRQLSADEEEARQRGFRVVDRRGAERELEAPPILKVSGGLPQKEGAIPPGAGTQPSAPPERVPGGAAISTPPGELPKAEKPAAPPARSERLLPQEWKQAVMRHLGGGGYANEPELEWAFSWADKNRNHLFTEETAKEAAAALNALSVKEKSAVSVGKGPSQSPKPKLSEKPPVALPPEQVGDNTTFKVTRGYPIEAKFAVVDESQLTASHDTELNENKDYPQELQPRSRDRAASELQVQRIYSELNPAQLGENPKGEHGSPIVGPDLLVEGGNGRLIALRRLIRDQHENYQAYKDWLATNAEKFGLRRSTIESIENPILVRVRRSEVSDRAEFARDLNEQDQARLSELEQAKSDAKRLNPDLLKLLRPSESGEIFNAQNQPFINAFVDKVVGGDKGEVLSARGDLSQQGVRRIRNAIFARAYPGSEVALERMAESTDSNIKNVANGMLAAAPKMMVLQGAVEGGQLADLSLAGEIDRAVSKLANLREEAAKAGKPAKQYIADWLRQAELPGMESEPITKELVRLFQQYSRSPRAVADVLEAYADGAVLKGRLDQGSLLGDVPIVTKEGLLKEAIAERGEPQAEMFGEPGKLTLEPPKEGPRETPPELQPPIAQPSPQEAVAAARRALEERIKTEAPDAAARRQFLRFALERERGSLPFLEQVVKDDPTPEAVQELAETRAKVEALKGMLAQDERLRPSRSDLLSDATEFISELNQSRNPARTPDEAWQRYLNNVGASRGNPTLEESDFKDAYDQMKLGKKPGGERKGAPAGRKLEPPPPKLYGGENKLVSRDKAEEYRKRMRERAKGDTLTAGIDPEAFSDLVGLGLFHLEAGARSFVDWAKVMLSEGGQGIKPYLKRIWDAVGAEAWRRAGTDPEMKKYVQSITEGGEARGDVSGRKGDVRPEKQPRGRRTLEPPPDAGGPGGDVAHGVGATAGGPGSAAKAPKPAFVPTYESRPSTATPVVSDAEWELTKRRYRMPEGSPRPTAQVSPELEAKLLPDTVPMANLALSSMISNDAVILASPTGEGKTYIASAVVKELLNRMGEGAASAQNLFVVPRAVFQKWIDVGSQYGLDMKEYPQGETIPPGAGNYVITYEQATGKPGIEAHHFDIVVADESHYARKWHESKRGGMLGELANNAGKAMFTSATPFHTEIEMGYLHKLGLWKPGQFENWVRQFGGRLERRGWVAGGDTRKLVVLQNSLIRDGRMVGRKRFLGGQHVNFAVVPLDAAQKGQLRDAAKAFDLAEQYYTSIKNSPAMRRAVLGNRVNFLKSFMERARIPAVIEMTKKLENQGWKVAIFTESKSESEGPYPFMTDADEHFGGEISRLWPRLPSVSGALKQALGDNVAIFMGESSGARNRELEAFNAGSKKHLAATFAAGGVGVDMHDTTGDSPRASIFLGPPWSGILLDQGLGRIYRGGSKSEAMSIFLTSDAKPEFETLVGKVIPRMKSLRAIISGVREGDPVINGLTNSSAAIDYALGGERKAGMDEFQQFLDTRGLHNYKEMPIPSAEEAKNKPRVVENLEPPPQPEEKEGGSVLYSGIDPIRAAREIGKLVRDVGNAVKGDKTTLSDQEYKRLMDQLGVGQGAKKVAELSPQDQEHFSAVVDTEAKRAASRDPNNPVGAAKGAVRDNLDRINHLDRLAKTSGIKGFGALWRTFLVTGRSTIRDLGRPVGDKIVKDIEFYHADAANIAGRYSARFYDAVNQNRLSDQEFSEAITMLQGGAESSNQRVRNAAGQMRKIFQDAWQEQRDHNITIPVSTPEGLQHVYPTRPDPHYFPRIYPPEVYEPGTRHRETVLDHLMRSRNMSRAEAEDYIDKVGSRDVPLAGNIEKPRTLDVEGYRKDPAVLYQYANQLGEVIARTKVFGQYREKLDPKVSEIPDLKNRKAVKAILDQLLEKSPADEGAQALNNFFSTWTAMSKMTFSAIPVMSHSVKSSMLTNSRAYLRGIMDVVKDYPGAKRAAMESGAIMDSLRDAALREYGVGRGTLGSRVLSYVGFFKADRIGRVIGDSTARIFLNKYALTALLKDATDPYYSRILKDRFHVSEADQKKAVESGAWSKEALDRAGARLAQIVQGTYDVTELPPGWRAKGDTPAEQTALALVKQAFALKSYIWKNGVVIKDALINEARKGNFRPWIPFLVLFPVVSEVLEDARRLTRGDTSRLQSLASMAEGNATPEQVLSRYAENLGLMGGANYASSFVDASFRNVPSWQFFTGPVLTDMFRGADTAMSVLKDIGDMFDSEAAAKHKFTPMERIERSIYGFTRSSVVPLRALMPPLGRSGGGSRALEPPPSTYSYPQF